MSGKGADLGSSLGYAFREPLWLQRALTHRSHGRDHNERLEFLGDSVLSLVVAEALFDRFPRLAEGDLSRLRAQLVRGETLAALARALDLGAHLALGEGESRSGGHDRDSILADALEAVFGAVLKDGGLDAARAVILRLYDERIRGLDPEHVEKDPKTRLQELLQKRGLPVPAYETVQISGEAHEQWFVVECRIEGGMVARGEGANRRQAEQDAAARAWGRVEAGK